MALVHRRLLSKWHLLTWSCGLQRISNSAIPGCSLLRKLVGQFHERGVQLSYKHLQFETSPNCFSKTFSVAAHFKLSKNKQWVTGPRKQQKEEKDFKLKPELTEEDIESVVSEILASAGKKDVMVQTVSRVTVREKVDDLLLKGWEPDMIKGVFVMHTAFLTKSKSKLNDIADNLCAFGFTNRQAATLLSSGIETDFSQKRLMESLDTLRKSGMKDGKLQAIVSKYPELLTYDSKSINNRVDALKALFKTDDIVPLFVKSPNILSDDWSRIFETFHYAFSTMGVKQRQMVNSKLFSYPLNFVKMRHIFVAKNGHYVRPRRDDDPVRMTNPLLKDIIDTSDETFAKKFGNTTLEDYKAFGAMTMKEFEKENQMNKDSDIDESDDDDDDVIKLDVEELHDRFDAK